MNERIKMLRKSLKLTQQDFAARIHVSRGALAVYEIGRNEPIDAVISLICREFNVNETWLRTGEGEMFLEAPDTALNALLEKYGLSHDARILVDEFVNLKPDIQQAVIAYVRKVAAALRFAGTDDSPEPPATGQSQLTELVGEPTPEPDNDAAIEEAARKKAEAYYEQLLLEARARTSEESTPAKTG